MALPDNGDRYELIAGELVNVGNFGMEHGNIGAFLCGLIELHVRPKIGSYLLFQHSIYDEIRK